MSRGLGVVHLSTEAETFIEQATPFWKPDAAAKECERCFTTFSFTVRRHHCRDCGGLFCGDCTPHRVALSYRPPGDDTTKHRVCTYCWHFFDMHQRQEHDRLHEARRMQQRAVDEGLMRRMVDPAAGGVEQLRAHMLRELLGRNRASLGQRAAGARSVAATSTKWSGSDDDGGYLAVDFVRAADALTKHDDNMCLRNNIVEPDKQWSMSFKKQSAPLRELLVSPVPQLPAPALALFLELSDKCGVNLAMDPTSPAGQAAIAARMPTQWHRVTEENIMDESSLVGVAAYFRT